LFIDYLFFQIGNNYLVFEDSSNFPALTKHDNMSIIDTLPTVFIGGLIPIRRLFSRGRKSGDTVGAEGSPENQYMRMPLHSVRRELFICLLQREY
jgi:hypothetical protein